MNLFDVAYLAAVPAIAPTIAWKRHRHGKYRESLPGMMGKSWPLTPLAPARDHRCWMHSVSVGETIGAGALQRELAALHPQWEFVCTTTTETGQAQARTLFEPRGARVTYAPADFSWIVRQFYNTYQPSLYIFHETEIWPNMLAEAGRRKLPVFLANGEVSERSAARYARFSRIFRPALSHVTRFFVQTTTDRERFAMILDDDSRIEVMGNIKFDALPEPLPEDERARVRASWGAAPGTLVVLAGSTHPGEEELIWRAWRKIAQTPVDKLLVIVPRHPERFDAVAEDLARWGARVHRTSTGPRPDDEPPGATDVILVDEMRVLAQRYGAADIALVAGSWAPIGGHNLLEAAVHGIPILRGPHMHGQQEIVRLLGPDNGALEVTEERLGSVIVQLLTQPAERARLGQLAQQAAVANRGAARRVAQRIAELTPARK